MAKTLTAPASIVPLVFFRVVFGILMTLSIVRLFAYGWVYDLYILPDLQFHYYGFEWLPRLTEFHTYMVFLVCGVSALFIALGLFYRWSTVLFFLSFSFIELQDLTYYLNHYYFISLISLVLIFLPAHHAYSLDVRAGRVQEVSSVPSWVIKFIRLLVGGLYFMAGVAKLNSEWLVHANPLQIWLPAHTDLPVIGALMAERWLAFAFSWLGALYDLFIPFLLLNRRTRFIAFLSVLFFHLITATLFPIGMFPYLMIGLAMVFFDADQLERILSLWGKFKVLSSPTLQRMYAFPKVLMNSFRPVVILVLFLLFLFPFRYMLFPGNLFWTEEGYRFSWRVMLMEKAGQSFFYVKDPAQPGEIEIQNDAFLTRGQEKQMSTQPDLILQFAHHLDEHYRELGVEDPIVRVEAWVSLNGAGSRLFIDPFTDLSEESDTWRHKEWILPFDSVVTANDLQAIKRNRRLAE